MSEPGAQRIVVLDDYQGVALEYGDWSRLPAGWEVVPLREHLEGEALEAVLAEAEIVVAMRERTAFPAALFERLPRLRLLVTTGMANASIDVAAAHRSGVLVSGTGIRGNGTLELAWGLILALARSIPREDAGVRAGGWQQTVGSDLAGATLGLVGLGRLGAAMVPVAQAFGMEVLAWSFNLDGDAARELGAEPVLKSELFRRSDVVSVHYKLGRRSLGLVGAEELAAMKPSAYLVNTSRGPIVDADALLAALAEGRIAGAGLDVFETEPLPPPEHPLRKAPRTVLTPHLGYVTRGTYEVFYEEAVEDVVAFLAGDPVRVIEPG
jgi:phosphoglycerate dehydrogenase-like enzyme